MDASQKFAWASLHLLLLSGPILGFASKGFAPLLAIAGTLALISIMLKPTTLKTIEWHSFWPVVPFIVFVFLSLFWSIAPAPYVSFGILLSVIIFTAALWHIFGLLPAASQAIYRDRLSFVLLLGVLCAIAVGSYPHTFPNLPSILRDVSSQTALGNIELLRQGNRSLSLMTIFLFLLVGFYGRHFPILSAAFLFITAYLTYISNSQTAFLGMLAGLSILVLVSIKKTRRRKIFIATFAIGLVLSPLIFIKSHQNNWVQAYAPKTIIQKASGEYRQWIYYVYANEAIAHPFFGHGFEASHNFSPSNLSEYVQEAQERKIYMAVRIANRNGTVQAHAHNFPLQIVFEFGYVGVLLFVMTLWQLNKLELSELGRPFQGAALGATFALLMFAHSLWQSWLLASLGFVFFYTGVLYRKSDARNP